MVTAANSDRPTRPTIVPSPRDGAGNKSPPDFALRRSPGSCERYLASAPLVAPQCQSRGRGLNGTCPHFCRHGPRREETRLLLRGLRRRCFLGGWRRLLHRCRRLRRGSLGRSLGRGCLLGSGLGRGLGSRLPGRSGFLCRSGLLGRCSLLCGCGAGLGGRCLLRRRFRGGLGCRLFGRCRLCLRRCRLRFGSGCCFLDRGRGFRRRRFYRCFLCRCLGCRRF